MEVKLQLKKFTEYHLIRNHKDYIKTENENKMIEFHPFTENDFDTLIRWNQTEEELVQFAGPIFTFPLTRDQLTNYIQSTSRTPLKVVLSSTNQTIGHCELNYENSIRRLSRILIGEKEWRGQNIGEHIVRKMVEVFFEDPLIKEVDLNVFDWNIPAQRCYKRVGFEFTDAETNQLIVNGKTWKTLNMILRRD